ncbi:hypothetical protein MKS88_005424 [Plasmodium brasilianum]|uniref:Uncharacterized protein n=2 Tax=Plasmodium (Plasmodium) TaxID=418103 RepID=A0A1A8X7L9_PLAMA|nr:conserved Plasmodium protein, unknown function [Plasmodium malariae]KAI4834745.1 hypothetical protein MKS88_005424 [Plasmodium brasilianum]SBT01245.1 hypothetical protein PMALA_080810 [Plasmodium malariae]SCP03302.1 conserved Plasmodium protein, unknown function [Plasmodium malariae]
MSRLQSSTKECYNTNAHLDSISNLNKCNDIFINSNFSHERNIPYILKMYANELHCSSDEHKSEQSHIKSENLLHQRTEHISDNTYLTSILHSSNVISSQNENCQLLNNKTFYSYLSSVDKNMYSNENKNQSSCLTSSVSTKNNPVEISYNEEWIKLESNEESNFIHNNKRDNSSNYEIKYNMKDNRGIDDTANKTNKELSNFYSNNSTCIKDHTNSKEESLNFFTKIDNSKNKHILLDCDNTSNDGSSSYDKSCDSSHQTSKAAITNNYPLNYSVKIPTEASHTRGVNTCTIKKEILNKSTSSNWHENVNNVCYSNGKIKIENKIQSKNSDLQNKSNLFGGENEGDSCSGKKKHKIHVEKISPNRLLSSQIEDNKTKFTEKNCKKSNTEEKTDASLYNKKLKSYSLDDLKKGKVQIPDVLFMKLPFNSKGDNLIDSYRRNNKLLSLMNDCNDSVSLILKYPQIEKKKQTKTFKIPTEISYNISSKIGSSIIYIDEFDRKNYHPHVKNLRMGKIFEKHVFSILKNKKDLGRTVFSKCNKYKKYKYNNKKGFWISNIDKRRLVNPEKNDSYITELVYEENNSYDKEIRELMYCKNYNVIPPIQELYKDNNFYLFLRKEKMCPYSLRPTMATTMRRYDIDNISGYKKVQTSECITAVYPS